MGLWAMGSTDFTKLLKEEQENPNHKSNDKAKKSTTHQINLKPKAIAPNTSTAVAIPSEKSADLQNTIIHYITPS